LQITYSIPYAMAASRVENMGLGQGTFNLELLDQDGCIFLKLFPPFSGLAMGVLNLAIVIPQVFTTFIFSFDSVQSYEYMEFTETG
jgi:solute carrier family 45, member 1/2/4